jgi:hypothetical protein
MMIEAWAEASGSEEPLMLALGKLDVAADLVSIEPEVTQPG